MSISCGWCGTLFRRYRGGSPKRFCSRACHLSYHGACRKIGMALVEHGATADGRLSIEVARIQADLPPAHPIINQEN